MNQLEQFANQERSVGKQVRNAVLEKIDRDGLSDEQFAQKLGFLPMSARMLRERETWPIDIAVRVAAALGLEILVEVKEPSDG